MNIINFENKYQLNTNTNIIRVDNVFEHKYEYNLVLEKQQIIRYLNIFEN